MVAINELADLKTIAHLTRYDSTFGRFNAVIEEVNGGLLINSQKVFVSHERDPNKLAWGDLAIDIVLECSGSFRSRGIAEQHLAAGAQRVIFSQPADVDVDATIVYGVNHQDLTGEERIISTGSLYDKLYYSGIGCAT